MTQRCANPIDLDVLVDYWSGDLTATDTDRIEQHVFACADCAGRLESLASLATGVAAVVRAGRVSGIISRSLLNHLQREGFRVRVYSLVPGETVPCAVFPDDDVVVTSLRASFTGVPAVRLSVTGPGEALMAEIDDIPVSGSNDEVLWASTGAEIRRVPSTRLRLTLTSAVAPSEVLGEYVLEHTASEQ